ncbi:MAG: Spy/CpxP family protein refolding chaperone, partial [Polyangiaceae bacterium]
MTLRPLALAACLTVLAGCTTTVEPQTPATDRGANAGTEATETSERDGMAELAERLGLTSTQQEKIEAIRDRLVERTRSADAQRLAFQDAIVGAIDACDSDYARLRIEGRRMIDSGNGAKPAILDAINEFHAVLTPEQRKRLIEPMLERSAERRERTDDEGFA